MKGYWQRVYDKVIELRKGNKALDADTAFHLARNLVDAEIAQENKQIVLI